jgi:hypothetical protein
MNAPSGTVRTTEYDNPLHRVHTCENASRRYSLYRKTAAGRASSVQYKTIDDAMYAWAKAVLDDPSERVELSVLVGVMAGYQMRVREPDESPYYEGVRLASAGRPIMTAIGYQLRHGIGTGSGEGAARYRSYVRGYHSVRPSSSGVR